MTLCALCDETLAGAVDTICACCSREVCDDCHTLCEGCDESIVCARCSDEYRILGGPVVCPRCAPSAVNQGRACIVWPEDGLAVPA